MGQKNAKFSAIYIDCFIFLLCCTMPPSPKLGAIRFFRYKNYSWSKFMQSICLNMYYLNIAKDKYFTRGIEIFYLEPMVKYPWLNLSFIFYPFYQNSGVLKYFFWNGKLITSCRKLFIQTFCNIRKWQIIC